MPFGEQISKHENKLILVGIVLWIVGIVLMPHPDNPLLSDENRDAMDFFSLLTFLLGTILISLALYKDPRLPENMKNSFTGALALLIMALLLWGSSQSYHPEAGTITIPSFRWIAVLMVLLLMMPELVLAVLIHKGIWEP